MIIAFPSGTDPELGNLVFQKNVVVPAILNMSDGHQHTLETLPVKFHGDRSVCDKSLVPPKDYIIIATVIIPRLLVVIIVGATISSIVFVSIVSAFDDKEHL